MQICESLGADGLIYQSVEDLVEVGRELNPNIEQFDSSCFTGQYVTGESRLQGKTPSEIFAFLGLHKLYSSVSQNSSD